MTILPRTPISSMILGAAACALLAVGCVSKSTHQKALEQNAALEAQNAELARRAELQKQQAEQEKSELEQTVAANAKVIKDLESQQQELASELDSEIQEGDVQVELMRAGVRINMGEDVLFDSGSAELNEDGQALVQRLAGRLKEAPYQVVVGGHTDSAPISEKLSKRYPSNWDLAAARAANVVRLLEEQGVEGDQLLAVSFGDKRPLEDNESAEGRAKNRRIEMRIRPVVVQEGDTEPVFEIGEAESESEG